MVAYKLFQGTVDLSLEIMIPSNPETTVCTFLDSSLRPKPCNYHLNYRTRESSKMYKLRQEGYTVWYQSIPPIKNFEH